jgi:hypothetical protein
VSFFFDHTVEQILHSKYGNLGSSISPASCRPTHSRSLYLPSPRESGRYKFCIYYHVDYIRQYLKHLMSCQALHKSSGIYSHPEIWSHSLKLQNLPTPHAPIIYCPLGTFPNFHLSLCLAMLQSDKFHFSTDPS